MVSLINFCLGSLYPPCSQSPTLTPALLKNLLERTFSKGETTFSCLEGLTQLFGVWLSLVDHINWWHLDIEKCRLSASGYRWTLPRHLANMCCWLISRWEFGEWANLVYWKWRTRGVVPSETRMPWVVLLCAVCSTLLIVSLLRGPHNNHVRYERYFWSPLHREVRLTGWLTCPRAHNHCRAGLRSRFSDSIYQIISSILYCFASTVYWKEERKGHVILIDYMYFQ